MVDDLDVDPGITVVDSQCMNCAHRDPGGQTICAAFPKGIPLIIFMGQFDHTQPYSEDGVLLDGGLRYEPLD
jgi:hypothetical protein